MSKRRFTKSTPFVFGHLAEGHEFTNRTKEINQLFNLFEAGINVTLISPRRWGKTSLVKAVAAYARRKKIEMRFCFIDMFTVRREEEFYKKFAESVIKASSGKFKEWVHMAKQYIPTAIPRVTFETPGGEFELGLNWKNQSQTIQEILDLPEKIARSKGMRIVVCIDEFQNIAALQDPLGFQKMLRAYWQQHEETAYCIYGSKREMMSQLFSTPSLPFYKFGELMYLDLIPEKEWAQFIQQRFKDTNKQIDFTDAVYIASLVDRHSYYVQQLAQQTWLRTPRKCQHRYIDEAHAALVDQMSLLFQEKTDRLSGVQIGYLQALVDGVEQFTSKDSIDSYGFGSSSAVQQAKQALVKKEILDTFGQRVRFLDPLYAEWLKRHI